MATSPVYALLYVSKSLLDYPEADAELAKIVAGSMGRNRQLGITGALVSTGSYFAQALEGERPAVEDLLASIRQDPRHTGLMIIRKLEEPRRFSAWCMVYSGYAGSVERLIAPFFAGLAAADATDLAQQLIDRMEAFSQTPPHRPALLAVPRNNA